MTSLDFQTYRLQLVREGPPPESPAICSPADVLQHVQPLFAGLDREHFVVLALDGRNQIVGANTASIGTLSASLVHPREVFKFAILANTGSIILAHNHPSGNTSPSEDDIQLTRRLRDAGDILGIEILDHLIITESDFVSLKEQGLI